MGTEKRSELLLNILDEHPGEEALYAYFDAMTDELPMQIAKLEYAAFDEVTNEGGRAVCQDNWGTFSIMRLSQYNNWTHEMLVRFATDFLLAYGSGLNIISEKYARMEESTAPQEWEKIKDNFPVIDEETKSIIEAIVGIQVKWMEDFAEKYPAFAGNARSIHTSEDTPFNTSYETYLRGELSTYSGMMLTLYGEFITSLLKEGKNLAYMTMEQTAKLYGYESVEDAENRQKMNK